MIILELMTFMQLMLFPQTFEIKMSTFLKRAKHVYLKIHYF